MKAARWIVAAACLLALAACKEKEPYRTAPAPFKGLPPSVRDAGKAAPSLPDEPPPREALRPLAVVLTPEGSILVSSRPGGADLSVRRVPGLVSVEADGTVRAYRAQVEPQKVKGIARESSFARLLVRDARAGAQDVEVATPLAERPDLKSAAKADPDLASEFFHRESLAAVAAHGSLQAWASWADGYLGGAHPYANRSLTVVDATAGRQVDLLPRFGGRDLAAEVLGAGAADACVRKVLGVAPAEGQGGAVQWIVALGHEFESCVGAFKLAAIEPPKGDAPVEAAKLPEGLPAMGWVDWRVAPDGGAAVLLLGLGKDDRVVPPWAGKGKADTRSRELRVWEKGMATTAVVGRVPSILTVQFLGDHAAPEKVLAGFAAL